MVRVSELSWMSWGVQGQALAALMTGRQGWKFRRGTSSGASVDSFSAAEQMDDALEEEMHSESEFVLLILAVLD